MSWQVTFAKQALKDIPKLKAAKLDKKAQQLLAVLENDPFQNPPPYEKLLGRLSGFYSRRINYQHRLVYEVNEETQTVRILSMWSHYEF